MTTLAELRLANLREQKKAAAAASDLASPEAPAEASPVPVMAAPVPLPREDDLVLSQFISVPAPDSVTADSVLADTVILEPEPAPAADPEAERSAALMARVQVLLAHKTLHPNGAKATVDMSPALFHRAKRYCLDHGNVTLRQLFLDLMTAFLDEEGY